MKRVVSSWLMIRGTRIALNTAGEVAPKVVNESYRQVFDVKPPITVFIHAASSRVTIRRQAGTRVELEANLRASFGWQIVAEQDDAGVYIVAKRKPVVGALSSAQFTLTVPPDARLLVDLASGALLLEDLNGKLDIPPIKREGNTAPPNPPVVQR